MSTEVPPVVLLFARVLFPFVCVIGAIVTIVVIATYNPRVDGSRIMIINRFSAYSYTALGIIGILLAYLILQTSVVFVCTRDGQGAIMFWRFFISTSGLGLDICPKEEQGALALSTN